MWLLEVKAVLAREKWHKAPKWWETPSWWLTEEKIKERKKKLLEWGWVKTEVDEILENKK